MCWQERGTLARIETFVPHARGYLKEWSRKECEEREEDKMMQEDESVKESISEEDTATRLAASSSCSC